MSEDLYNSKILSWSSRLITPLRLEPPYTTAQLRGKLCGSSIRVDLRVTDGIITGYGHEVLACRLGSAAAAVIQHNIVGQAPEEMVKLCGCMESMLLRAGDPPRGPWRELDMFLPVRGNRFRASSVLLPFQAVVRALDSSIDNDAVR